MQMREKFYSIPGLIHETFVYPRSKVLQNLSEGIFTVLVDQSLHGTPSFNLQNIIRNNQISAVRYSTNPASE
jgi:hypothetical protein